MDSESMANRAKKEYCRCYCLFSFFLHMTRCLLCAFTMYSITQTFHFRHEREKWLLSATKTLTTHWHSSQVYFRMSKSFHINFISIPYWLVFFALFFLFIFSMFNSRSVYAFANPIHFSHFNKSNRAYFSDICCRSSVLFNDFLLNTVLH